MPTPVTFLRPDPGKIVASASEEHLTIISTHGFSIIMLAGDAVRYAKQYNKHPNEGFYEIDGKVALSHECAKIWLSQQEAAAVLQLIKAAWGPGGEFY